MGNSCSSLAFFLFLCLGFPYLLVCGRYSCTGAMVIFSILFLVPILLDCVFFHQEIIIGFSEKVKNYFIWRTVFHAS